MSKNQNVKALKTSTPVISSCARNTRLSTGFNQLSPIKGGRSSVADSEGMSIFASDIDNDLIDEEVIKKDINSIKFETTQDEVRLDDDKPGQGLSPIAEETEGEEGPPRKKVKTIPPLLQPATIPVKNEIYTNLQVFHSNDEAENKDNEHPKWKKIQALQKKGNIENVFEERWGKMEIPNPNENLTTFSWVKKNRIGFNHNKIRRGDPVQIRQRVYVDGPCTKIFEYAMDRTKALWHTYRSNILSEMEARLSQLAYRHEQERFDERNYYGNHASFGSLYAIQGEELESVREHYKQRLHENEMIFEGRLFDLKIAMDETTRLYSFYRKLTGSFRGSPMFFTGQQLSQWIAIDETLNAYQSEFYRR